MSSIPGKSSEESIPSNSEHPSALWFSYLYSTGLKEHGYALVILIICIYQLLKSIGVWSIWRKTTVGLPFWMSEPHNIEKRIDSLTTDLRMEMRELSEQINEFQKWSKQKFDEPVKCDGNFRKQSQWEQNSFQYPQISKRNTISPYNASELNGSWLQYLHKYVSNPNPRILDTGELEIIKRASPNWFHY